MDNNLQRDLLVQYLRRRLEEEGEFLKRLGAGDSLYEFVDFSKVEIEFHRARIQMGENTLEPSFVLGSYTGEDLIVLKVFNFEDSESVKREAWRVLIHEVIHRYLSKKCGFDKAYSDVLNFFSDFYWGLSVDSFSPYSVMIGYTMLGGFKGLKDHMRNYLSSFERAKELYGKFEELVEKGKGREEAFIEVFNSELRKYLSSC